MRSAWAPLAEDMLPGPPWEHTVNSLVPKIHILHTPISGAPRKTKAGYTKIEKGHTLRGETAWAVS